MSKQFKHTVTFSSRVKNFEWLHMYAALLEDTIGWNCLIPVDISKYVKRPIVEEATEHRHNLSYLDIHKQKMDISDGLFVYLDSKDLLQDYEGKDTMREIKYAMDNNLRIYFSIHPKDLSSEFFVYVPPLDYHVKVGYEIVLNGSKMSEVDDGTDSVSLFNIEYTKIM